MILVVFSDESYEYQVGYSLKSLEKKITDDVKVVYFTIGFDSNINIKNLYKIRLEKVNNYHSLNYYKPELCLKALQLFPDEQYFIYADSDVLYSRRFSFKKLTYDFDHPMASCGPHEYIFTYEIINGEMIQYNELKLMNYFNVEKRTMWYVFSCFFTFNRMCKDFLEEWMSMCQNKFLLKHDKYFFPFKDETSFNICLWKRKISINLGFIFVNTHDHNIVELVENNDIVEKYGGNVDQLKNNWEYIKNSNDVILYHGFKEKKHITESFKTLKNYE